MHRESLSCSLIRELQLQIRPMPVTRAVIVESNLCVGSPTSIVVVGPPDWSTFWLRRTPHTHHPVDDALGNAEALLSMKVEFGLNIRL